MKNLRNILFLLIAMIVLSAFPTFMLADSPTQVDPSDATDVSSEAEIPPLVGGAPYPFPIISYEAPDAPDALRPDAPAAPSINVWYGTNQTFGTLGTPQQWINILGTVSGSLDTMSLSYSLNGSPDKPLNIGYDPANRTRLFDLGDFNIELDYKELNNGANTVVIKANDGTGQTNQTVTVNYTQDTKWPLPYTENWDTNLTLQSGTVQVVDGLWGIENKRLEVIDPGYDRLVALGDMSWTDYEVTVPVTVKSLNTAEWGKPSNGAGVGLMVRWLGHTNTAGPGEPTPQPLEGWRRFGALAWYRWNLNGTSAFELRGNGGNDLIPPRTDFPIELNKAYIFKLGVQSSAVDGQPATYRFKVWRQGDPEPAEWYMTSVGNVREPNSGSLVLVAHQAVVSWGRVTVRPITTEENLTITVKDPANGDIYITPNKPKYAYGERVQIRAQGVQGYGLAGWTDDFSGTKNPIEFDITQDVTVGATFTTLAQQPTLTVNVNGQGTVNVSPQKSSYLYGEAVTLTPKPQMGYIFSGWSGDLSGANNPGVVVMDRSKSVTANFIQGNANSPVSDDFNSCTLNTGLWTFVNPLGDGSYATNGTQLQLNVPANVSHNAWLDGNKTVRVMQPTQNVNFEMMAKFDSVVTLRYQMQGFIIEQDAQNYLRIEANHDGVGTNLFVARIRDGSPRQLISFEVPNTPPYLRVTRVGSQWGLSYSSDGNNWLSGGSFIHSMTVTKTGVFAGNHGSLPFKPAPAHSVFVDYFFNTASPIVPEDGDSYQILVNKVGQGTVTVEPLKDTYACGEVVKLTALPANGWVFSGWSGDLSGSEPTKQISMTRSYAVTAVFTDPTIEEYRIFLPMGVNR